jgi:hypothetical protein
MRIKNLKNFIVSLKAVYLTNDFVCMPTCMSVCILFVLYIYLHTSHFVKCRKTHLFKLALNTFKKNFNE